MEQLQEVETTSESEFGAPHLSVAETQQALQEPRREIYPLRYDPVRQDD